MVLKNLFTGQQWRNRHREQTYGHGERGEGGEMYGKSNMETYITICKIDSQREFACMAQDVSIFFKFAWNVTAFQCCASFYYTTSVHISLSPSPSPPF